MRTVEFGSLTEIMEIVTDRDIHAALVRKGYSCRSWALEKGFNPRTVLKCIREHHPSSQKEVTGLINFKILQALSETLETDLTGKGND